MIGNNFNHYSFVYRMLGADEDFKKYKNKGEILLKDD